MRKRILSLLLCFLLSVSLVTTCGATAMYQLTESQLTQLENNISQLEQNSKEQDRQLQKVSDLLLRSDKQTQLLSEKLILAEKSITQTQILLNQANQSFEQLERANKSKIRSLTLQRDLLIVGIIGMAFRK